MSLLKKISTIASSSMLSQVIGAVSIWLISTSYGMADVGYYAMTYSIALIGAQVCTFASQLLIPKQAEDTLGQNIIFCLLFSLLLSVFVALATGFFFERSYEQLFLLILGHSWILISENLLLRDSKMKVLALQRTTISGLVLTLIYIMHDMETFYWAWGGALLAYVSIFILYSVPAKALKWSQFSLSSNIRFFKNNSQHITKVGSAEILAMLNGNLPVILINIWFTPVVAGYFAVVSRFCLSPVIIVGNAVRNSIFSNWSIDFRNNRFNYSEFVKVRKLLMSLGVIATAGVFIFYPIVMNLGFNDEWIASIPTSRYLLPYLFTALAICPLTVIELVYGSPKYFLRIQIEQLAVVLIAFALMPYISPDYAYSVITFALLSALRYAFIFIRVNSRANEVSQRLETV